MRKYSKETIVGIFVVTLFAGLAYMTLKLGHISIRENTYPLYAPFTSVDGLRVGSPVDIFGIEVGRVEKITLDQKDQLAKVEMGIKKGVRVYEDAIASIKTEGLIGDAYLSIDPGGAEKVLGPGGIITDTTPAVDILDLIEKYAFGQIKKD